MKTVAEPRSLERLRHHYEVEKTLAARLRAAPREQRLHMLTGLYEELFREVPDHPRLTRNHAPQSARRRIITQMRLLRRFLLPRMTVLEIGPGDCTFAFELAKSVRQVYGVEVDAVASRHSKPPRGTFAWFMSDGVSVPVPPRERRPCVQQPVDGAPAPRRRARSSCATSTRPSPREAPTCA